MRTLLHPVAFGVAVILVSPPAAAGAAPPSRDAAAVEFVETDSPEAAAVRHIGETAIKWLGARMVFEVKSTLARKSPEGTVGVCHLKAVTVAGQVLPGMPSIKAFNLTSERLLNAANAADAAEQAALDRVKRSMEQGDAPDEMLLQRITAPDGSVEWRVYQPLAVLASCVMCHGDPATQSPALQTLLREKAPANAAIGYTEGEWRGLLRVTVAPPVAK